jgi:HK97 family phage prohead protease
MDPTIERRFATTFGADNKVELRVSDDGKKATLTGYAVVYNRDSVPLYGGEFIEQIADGAFKRTLATGEDVRALVEHDSHKLLGRTSANTLRLIDDAKGLRFELDLPDVSYGRDVRTLIERGDIAGCSFGFRSMKDEWNELAKPARRRVIDADLREITITSNPAYTDTTVAVRSLQSQRPRPLPLSLAEAMQKQAEAQSRI